MPACDRGRWNSSTALTIAASQIPKDVALDPILSQLAGSVPAARSIEQLTRPLLDMLGAVTGLESTYLTSIDLDQNVQHVRFARNVGDMTIPEGLSVPWDDTLCKRAIDEGRMSTSNVASCWGDSDAARALGIQTYVSAPIRDDNGALVGTLCAAGSNQRVISADAESVLRLFSNLVANYIERERLLENLQSANQRLMSYALTDPLTGLANRRALYEDLQRLLSLGVREKAAILVGVIDLDGFKTINDEYGHQCGDLFLQEMARRLRAGLRASDMLGRLGGDEFVIVGLGPALPVDSPAAGMQAAGLQAVGMQAAGLQAVGLQAKGVPAAGVPAAAAPNRGVIDSGDLHAAAQILQGRAAASTVGEFQLGSHTLQYAGASVGVVAVDPAGIDAEAAVKLADARMYEVKRARKQQQHRGNAAAAREAVSHPASFNEER
jgi:diguanylate cyclase